jgi:hypothetical protein
VVADGYWIMILHLAFVLGQTNNRADKIF